MVVADGDVAVEAALQDADVGQAGDAEGLDAQVVLVAPERGNGREHAAIRRIRAGSAPAGSRSRTGRAPGPRRRTWRCRWRPSSARSCGTRRTAAGAGTAPRRRPPPRRRGRPPLPQVAGQHAQPPVAGNAVGQVEAVPASHSVLGREPTDSTIRSASSVVPSVRVTARTRPSLGSPSKATGAVPSRNRTPRASCLRSSSAASSSPSGRRIGSGSGSTTVTSRPRVRAAAATSQPMKPPPTTTMRRASSRSLRSSARSSSVLIDVPSGQRPRQVQAAGPDPGGDHQAVPAEHRCRRRASRSARRGPPRWPARRAASRCSSRRPAPPGTAAGPRRTRRRCRPSTAAAGCTACAAPRRRR